MNTKILKQAGLTKQSEHIEQHRCPLCGDEVNSEEFRDKLSRDEFAISGMCQKCQDRIFG